MGWHLLAWECPTESGKSLVSSQRAGRALSAHTPCTPAGLPLGGFLAHPDRHLGSFFSGQFWKDYPFSLPCFVGGAVAVLSALFGLLFIREVRNATRSLSSLRVSPASRSRPSNGL